MSQDLIKEIQQDIGIEEIENDNSGGNALDALEALSSEIQSEISVYLPGLDIDAVVTPLTGKEDLSLKTSKTTLSIFTEKLNKVLFERTKFPEEIQSKLKNYKDFQKLILPCDKAMLIYALIKTSYEKISDQNITCENPDCQKEFVETFDVNQIEVHVETLLKDTEFKNGYSFKFKQEFLGGALEIYIGMNSEEVKLELLKRLEKENKNPKNTMNQMMSLYDTLFLVTKEIVIKSKKTGEVITKLTSDTKKGRNEIYKFYKEMSPKIRDNILNEMDLSEMNDYLPEFNIVTHCPYCHTEMKTPISVEDEFFRKALFIYE